MKHTGVRLLIASATEAVRDVLERFGVIDRIGVANFFPTVHAAVEAALAEREKQSKEQASITVHSNGTAAELTATAEARDEGSHELRQRRGHWWDGLLPSSKPKETYIELADI